jgi:hypothetical protein
VQQQRANKARIKEALRRIPGMRFRDVPDEAGDCGDSLVFVCESPRAAKRIAADLQKDGVGFKNLPDALNWHFAGVWDHIFSVLPGYGAQSWRTLWEPV